MLPRGLLVLSSVLAMCSIDMPVALCQQMPDLSGVTLTGDTWGGYSTSFYGWPLGIPETKVKNLHLWPTRSGDVVADGLDKAGPFRARLSSSGALVQGSLVRFPPGRLIENRQSGEPVVACDGVGGIVSLLALDGSGVLATLPRGFDPTFIGPSGSVYSVRAVQDGARGLSLARLAPDGTSVQEVRLEGTTLANLWAIRTIGPGESIYGNLGNAVGRYDGEGRFVGWFGCTGSEAMAVVPGDRLSLARSLGWHSPETLGQACSPGQITDVAVDDAGCLYVCLKGFICKYGPSGGLLALLVAPDEREVLRRYGLTKHEDPRSPKTWPGGDRIAVDGPGNIYCWGVAVRRYACASTSSPAAAGATGLSAPSACSAGADGVWCVADWGGNRVVCYGPDGQVKAVLGEGQQEDGELRGPYGIAIDASGGTYVADTGNHRIQKFGPDGKFIAKWGSQGDGEGQFSSPGAVALGPGGEVYVSDSGNNRIQKFTSDGKFVTAFGQPGEGEGQLRQPLGLAVGTTGDVWVVDMGNSRVQRFAADGRFVAKWGSDGTGEGQLKTPFGIALDASGNVYVADVGNDRIQKLTPEGTFIAAWTEGDKGPLKQPYGVSVAKDGTILVADTGNNRIQTIRPQ